MRALAEMAFCQAGSGSRGRQCAGGRRNRLMDRAFSFVVKACAARRLYSLHMSQRDPRKRPRVPTPMTDRNALCGILNEEYLQPSNTHGDTRPEGATSG